MKLLSEKNDRILNIFVLLSMGFYPLLYFLNEFTNTFILYGTNLDSIALALLYGVVGFFCIPIIIKRQGVVSLLVLVFFFVAFFVSIFFGLSGAPYAREKMVFFFLTVLPFVFLGQGIREYQTFEKLIPIFLRIVIAAVSFWTYISVFFTYYGTRIAYMGMSYYFLPFSIMIAYLTFSRFSFFNLVLFVIVFVNHFLWGTRGPILLLLIYSVICFLIYEKKYFFSRLFFLLFISLFLYGSIMLILNNVNYFLQDYGLINGGLINILEADDLSDGRNDLSIKMLSLIKDNFWFGQGVFSERAYLETYSHNLFLEFFCDYGVIISATLFFLFFMRVIQCFAVISFHDIRFCLLSVSLILGIGKLLFSGSYLDDPYFFFMIGFVYNKSLLDTKTNIDNNSTRILSTREPTS